MPCSAVSKTILSEREEIQASLYEELLPTELGGVVYSTERYRRGSDQLE